MSDIMDKEDYEEEGYMANNTEVSLTIEFNGTVVEIPVGHAMYFDSPMGEVEIIINETAKFTEDPDEGMIH